MPVSFVGFVNFARLLSLNIAKHIHVARGPALAGSGSLGFLLG